MNSDCFWSDTTILFIRTHFVWTFVWLVSFLLCRFFGFILFCEVYHINCMRIKIYMILRKGLEFWLIYSIFWLCVFLRLHKNYIFLPIKLKIISIYVSFLILFLAFQFFHIILNRYGLLDLKQSINQSYYFSHMSHITILQNFEHFEER